MSITPLTKWGVPRARKIIPSAIMHRMRPQLFRLNVMYTGLFSGSSWIRFIYRRATFLKTKRPLINPIQRAIASPVHCPTLGAVGPVFRTLRERPPKRRPLPTIRSIVPTAPHQKKATFKCVPLEIFKPHSFRRCLRTSYATTPNATETLSDETCPLIGIEII